MEKKKTHYPTMDSLCEYQSEKMSWLNASKSVIPSIKQNVPVTIKKSSTVLKFSLLSKGGCDTSVVSSSYFSAPHTPPIFSKTLHKPSSDDECDLESALSSLDRICVEGYTPRSPDIMQKCIPRYVERRMPLLPMQACKTHVTACGKGLTSMAIVEDASVNASEDVTLLANENCYSATEEVVTLLSNENCYSANEEDVTILSNENCLDVSSNSRKRHRQFDALQVHDEMINIFHDVWARHGNGCSEATYQRAVARRAYLDGLPIMMERDLYADYGEGYLLAGRIDMEVASSCLYEMKIGPVKLKDCLQVKKYLRAYDHSTSDDIKIASSVYFTSTGVVVHDVRNHCGGRAKGVSIKRW